MDKDSALPKLAPSKIIDALGGNKPVSNICMKADGTPLTDAAVSYWRSNGIPDGWLRYLWLKFGAKLRRLK